MFRKFTLLVAFAVFSSNVFSQGNALDIGINYVKTHGATYQLTEADLSDYVVTDNYMSKHNQVTHIYMLQRHQGIIVSGAMINLNIKNDKVLFWNTHFVPDLQSKVNTTKPSISATGAAKTAAENVGLTVKETFRVLNSADSKKLMLSRGGVAMEDIAANLVYFPVSENDVRLVWEIVIYENGAQNKWNVKVDAVSNQVLEVDNEVISCNFDHVKYNNIDRLNRKLKDYHYGVGVPYKAPAFDGVTKGNMASSYNVFAYPIESPIHGSRTIEIDPDDPIASPYGWHDDNGAAGAEYTITRGNNVHAYSDSSDTNNSIGDEPDGGAGLVFDFPLDLTLEPEQYKNAAVTNLFYWNNMIHDVWYQYGFDEAGGNFQENNYGNGGAGSDYVRAEAQDGGGTNNANFATPSDGQNPRMQMYLWGNTQPDQLLVNSPVSVAGTYPAREPVFGPGLPAAPLTAPLVLVDDGTLAPSEGCNALVNGNALSGNIAMIDRGNCQFGVKILNAENAGAVGAIICNNVNTGLVTMGAGTAGGQVTIPSIFMTIQDCNTIKAALGTDSVIVTLQDASSSGPDFIDGDFDNGVIVHEYTHGISTRLTGGPSSSGCLGNEEQQGEGWSDWFALVMTVEPGDMGTDKRGMGVYADGQGINGNGIRTHAYSTNFAINPHTYNSIINEAAPHGVGSVWSAMIWDLYWAFVAEYGYDNDIYNGTGGNNMAMQLVIDGMKFQACNPSFIEARDAILAADLALNTGANECLIWEVFAKRGLGWGATSNNGDDKTDGVESFDIPPYCSDAIVVLKTADEEVQAGSPITYTIEVQNLSPNDVTNVTVKDTLPPGTFFIPNSGSCNATESNGIVTINLGTITPQANKSCTFQVNTSTSFFTTVDYIDSFETITGDWIEITDIGTAQWQRKVATAHSGTHAYHAINPAATSDFALTSSNPYTVGGTRPVLSFWHRYRTNPITDGGVVEISNDFLTWTDLGQYMIKNGYNANINSPVLPPASTRAFSGNNFTYHQTLVDLSSFIGQNVYFRFRMTCDDSGADLGWYIDDVSILDLYTIDNIACADTDQGKFDCGSASTIINAIPTSTKNEKSGLGVYLYPNPTDNLVNINIQGFKGGNVVIDIIDVAGRVLLNKNFDNLHSGSIPMDVKSLSAGVYFVKIKTEEGFGIERLVISE